MIKLIVTAGGYVESNQMAHIIWSTTQNWLPEEIDNGALEPANAFKSLSNEICEAYLIDYMWVDHNIHWDCKTNSNKDLTMVYCPKCSKPMRQPFDSEAFRSFVYDLCRSTGSEDMCLDELEHWWPWHSFDEIYTSDIKPEEILLVEENFDVHAAASVVPSDIFTEDDKADIKEFIEEHPYKVVQKDNGFWTVETIYYGDDISERVN